MGINFQCSPVTLRHEGLSLFLMTSSRLIEWKRTNCKMITLNKISAKAGIQENTGFPPYQVRGRLSQARNDKPAEIYIVMYNFVLSSTT